MPTTLQIKYSTTTTAAPTTADLTVPAELAVNVTDGQLYTRDDLDNIRKLGGATDSSGNVTFSNNVTVGGDLTVTGDTNIDGGTTITGNTIVEGNTTVEGNLVVEGTTTIRPGVINSAATTYTLDADDENKLILFSSGSAVTITVPLEATTSLPIGFITHLHQGGAGQLTVVGEGGVTVNAASSLLTRTQYSALSLFKVAENSWTVVGDQE